MHRNNIGRTEIIDRENVAVGLHQPTPNKGAPTSSVRKQAFGDLKNVIHNQSNVSLVKSSRPESKSSEATSTIKKPKPFLKKQDTYKKTVRNDEVTWIENSGISSFWTDFEKTIQSSREQKKKLLEEKVKQIEIDHITFEEETFLRNLNEERQNIKIDMALEKLPQLKAPVLPDFPACMSLDGDDFLNW